MCLGIHREYKREKKTGLHQEENFDRSKKKNKLFENGEKIYKSRIW